MGRGPCPARRSTETHWSISSGRDSKQVGRLQNPAVHTASATASTPGLCPTTPSTCRPNTLLPSRLGRARPGGCTQAVSDSGGSASSERTKESPRARSMHFLGRFRGGRRAFPCAEAHQAQEVEGARYPGRGGSPKTEGRVDVDESREKSFVGS